MSTSAVVLLFLIMIVAPCVVAVRSSSKYNEDGTDPLQIDAPEVEPEAIAAPVILAGADAPRTRTTALQDLAYEAEVEAYVAEDRAEQARWASLIAQARAAAIRADVAAETAARAGRDAQKAILAAEGQYLPQSHPSLDFPRSRVRRTAA